MNAEFLAQFQVSEIEAPMLQTDHCEQSANNCGGDCDCNCDGNVCNCS